MKERVERAWEFRYFQSVEDCIDAVEDFEESLKNGVKLVKYLEVFRNEAAKAVKQLIIKIIMNMIGKTEEEPEVETKKPNMARKSTAVK